MAAVVDCLYAGRTMRDEGKLLITGGRGAGEVCGAWIHSPVWPIRPLMVRAPGCGGARAAPRCDRPRGFRSVRRHPSSSAPHHRFPSSPPGGSRTRTPCTNSSGLIGVGCGYGLSSVTTFLLLRADPYNTPRIFTWLSGTTCGRTLPDIVPVAVALALALPLLLGMRRRLGLLAVDEDTPRVVGVRLERTRFTAPAIAAVLAALSVIAVGVVGFVGLVAPHLARSLVGARHGRVIPVALPLGGLLVCVADALGRTLVAPAQLPAGLMIALVGAPYVVWVLRRSRA